MYIFSTCAVTLKFMTTCDVPGVRWMCSCTIIKQILIYEKILHILSVFRPFPLTQKEYKRVLECKISNLQLSIRGRGQSILEIVGAIIHSQICYLLLTKEIQSFFIRFNFYELCLGFIILKFSSFLRLRYS